MSSQWETIFQNYGAESDGAQLALTRHEQLQKSHAFREMLAETRDTIVAELQECDKRVILPAKDGRKSMGVYRKIIKRREDRKLDWERYKSRTEAIERKGSRSERDNVALAKHQVDLEVSQRVWSFLG